METIAGQYTKAGPPTAAANTDLPIQVDALGRLIITGAVTISGAVGSVTWGAPTPIAVTAGPTSTVLIAANALRKALRIWNPIGNAQMSYDISGGAAVLATGTPMLAGDEVDFTDEDAPLTAVTFIGTAGQSLVYQEGT